MVKEEDVQRLVKRYVHRLARNIAINKAILTGSWATGTNLKDSDVDLIIVSDDFSKMLLSERLQYLHKQWKSKSIPLEAFGYTIDEFRKLKRTSMYVKDAVSDGLVLVDSEAERR